MKKQFASSYGAEIFMRLRGWASALKVVSALVVLLTVSGCATYIERQLMRRAPADWIPENLPELYALVGVVLDPEMHESIFSWLKKVET